MSNEVPRTIRRIGCAATVAVLGRHPSDFSMEVLQSDKQTPCR